MRASLCVAVLCSGGVAVAPTPAAQAADAVANLPSKYRARFDGFDGLADRDVQEAIARGLAWLRRHQDRDGRFSPDRFMQHDAVGTPCDGPGLARFDVGVSGLALLAFLADGNSPRRGDFAPIVRRGVTWLCRSQDPETGRIGSNAVNEFVYNHTIAALAVIEAYGLSGDPTWKVYAQRAVDYVGRHRTPDGGWRYQPRDNDFDTSVTSWATVVCQAADDFELAVDPRAFRVGETMFDTVTDPANGRTGYTHRGGLSARRAGRHARQFPRERSEAMTAAALFTRYFLGRTPAEVPIMHRQAELLADAPPRWDPGAGTIDLYYWYYGTLAMRQAGARRWKAWSKALHEALLPSQRDDGNFDGSWDPIGVWGEDGGRVYATALAVLSLQAGYRYADLAEVTILPDDKMFRAANRAWSANDFERFDAALARLEDDESLTEADRAVLARGRRKLTRRLDYAAQEVELLATSTRYLQARDRLREIRDRFGTSEPGRAAGALLKRFAQDDAIKEEIKAAERLVSARARYDAGKSKERRKLVAVLESLVERYRETNAGREAATLLIELRKRR